MKKNPEATALTRQSLMEAFWGLYCEKRIERISIKQITDRAGYHRSTFYEYFVDIHDVLEQLEDALLVRAREKVLSSLEVDQNVDASQMMADFYESMGDHLAMLLGERRDPYFAQRLHAVIKPALAKRFGLPENDVHTSYITEFGLSAIIATIGLWYQNDKNLSAKELIVLIRSMLKEGVLPQVRKFSKLRNPQQTLNAGVKRQTAVNNSK